MSSKMPSKDEASDLVLSNAVDFLNSGLDLLFDEDVDTRQAKASVVLIQTAIELMAKYRLLRQNGLGSIVRGVIPKGNLVKLSRDGAFRTIGYGECLKAIREEEAFTTSDEELVSRVQQLRNSLVHFAAEIDVEDVRTDIAWLLIRALAMFAAGEERDQGEMQTHARFLDPGNFDRLISFPPYRAEAVDSAQDSFDSEDVMRCWECGVDALSVRPSDNYFCHCCGLTVILEAAAFTSCDVCQEKNGVCYDPLNETNGACFGRCLHCKTVMNVWVCPDCDKARSQAPGLKAPICVECADE